MAYHVPPRLRPKLGHYRPLPFLSRITGSRSDRLSSDELSNLDHGGYGQVAHHRPHVEVSEDYYAIFASNRSRQPEHHLMRAVLEHAIRAAQNDSKGSRALRERREAVAWIMDQDRSDRKSTRLNSSHITISYAVFC